MNTFLTLAIVTAFFSSNEAKPINNSGGINAKAHINALNLVGVGARANILKSGHDLANIGVKDSGRRR